MRNNLLSSIFSLLAGAASSGTASPPLPGGLGYSPPSWLTAFPDVPSSPNGRSFSGVAAAKRLARKQRNQRRARLARHA